MKINTVLQRLREPSSWSGIAVIFALLGFSQEEANAVINLLAVGSAAAGVFLQEQPSQDFL